MSSIRDLIKARSARLSNEGFGNARFPDSIKRTLNMLYGRNATGKLTFELLQEILNGGNELVPIHSIKPDVVTSDDYTWLAQVDILKGDIERAILLPQMKYPDRTDGPKTDRYPAIYVKGAKPSLEGTLAFQTGLLFSNHVERQAISQGTYIT